MAMQSLRKGASSGILKFFLMGTLVLAAGGLVMTDVGGFFRGGISKSDIGRVGKTKIQAISFDRSLRRTLQRLGMSPGEAYKLGYVDQFLNSEIQGLLVQQSARKIGINVGRKHIAAEINKIVEPMALGGRSTQEVLDQILFSQGMSEGTFVSTIGREVGNGLLMRALRGGSSLVSDDMAEDIFLFQSEQRDIDIVVFPDKELKDIKAPSGAQLEALYGAMKENYAQAETRNVILLSINDEKLKATIDITQEELRAAYDDNIEAYKVPEKRKLEQSILSTEEEAAAVLKAVQSGKSLKGAIKAETGEDSAYIEAQDFEEDGMLPEIAEIAFKAGKGDAGGPVQTALGWHVIVLKDIIPPSTQSFESVKKDLKEEFQQIKLSDQLYELANAIDDLLAGGASLEEIKQEVEVNTIALPVFNSFGQGADEKDALKDHETNRVTILETAFELLEGETSAMMEMSDGAFLAIHVEKIQPKTYTPFAEMRAEIEKKWNEDQRRIENRMRVMALLSAVESSEKSLKGLAREQGKTVKSLSKVKRQGEAPAPLNSRAVNIIFDAPVHGYALIETQDGSALVEVKSFSFPEGEDEEKTKALSKNLATGGQNEVFQAYINNKQQNYGVVINSDLLGRLYGPGSEL